jgi:hypothetical protein
MDSGTISPPGAHYDDFFCIFTRVAIIAVTCHDYYPIAKKLNKTNQTKTLFSFLNLSLLRVPTSSPFIAPWA